jgi:type IV secretion system protein VirD4
MSQPIGKPTIVFNPHSEDSFCFDPFAFLRADGKANLARNAKELALSLVALMPANDDSVWVKAAQNLLAGIIVMHVEIGSTFSKTMETMQLSDVDELIDAIKGSDNDTAKMFISKLRNLKPETLAGVGMDLTDLAILAADPRIEAVLSPNENTLGVIEWNLLNTATEPLNIVLQIPEEDLDVWTPMTTMLINQLIRTLQRRTERKYNAAGETLPPVLIILDEFPALGKIASIKAGMATLRSRGVTFSLVIQSLAQLDEIYTPIGRRVIFELCPYKVILNVTDPESQKYFSEAIGTLIVSRQSVSTTYDYATKEAKNYNLTVNESREPIIHPHEFATLTDVVLMTPEGYCRIDKAPYFEPAPLVDFVDAIIIE